MGTDQAAHPTEQVRHLQGRLAAPTWQVYDGQIAVASGQLSLTMRDGHPPALVVRVLSDDECRRVLEVAQQVIVHQPVRWDLLIATALCTGMRRGELRNTTWADIDFEKGIVHVSPKKDTAEVW